MSNSLKEIIIEINKTESIIKEYHIDLAELFSSENTNKIAKVAGNQSDNPRSLPRITLFVLIIAAGIDHPKGVYDLKKSPTPHLLTLFMHIFQFKAGIR